MGSFRLPEIDHPYPGEAPTASGSPLLGRLPVGAWAWMGGCRRRHASRRYRREAGR